MTAFSWEKAINDGLNTKLRRARIMAKTGCNQDFNIKHPSECKDAQQGNHIQQIKRVKEEFKRRQDEIKLRRIKLGPRL